MGVDADVIIVGSGAAGCVLAHRLSEDPDCRVLVLEHGGRDRHPWLRVPKGFARALTNPEFVRAYETSPVVAGGGPEYWLRGRVLGGSTSVNGSMYARSGPADHAELAAVAGAGWSWPTMLAAYRAMEDHALGSDATRGVGGPLPVDVAPVTDRVGTAVLDAAAAVGLTHVTDVNAVAGARVGATPATIRRGVRMSAARAFLRPVRRRPNLVVATRQRVLDLVMEGDRVVGVRARGLGGVEEVHRAEREVVLAGGTIESPLLLERSGIGEPERLAAAGIDVRVPSPRVGEGVIEQRSVEVRVRLRTGLGNNHRLDSSATRGVEALRYAVTRRGPLATPAYEVSAAVATDPASDRVDAQVLFTALSTDASGLAVADHAGMTAVGYPLRPTTTSSVHVTAPDVDTAPRIEAAFLVDDADRATTVRTLGWIRHVLATGRLAGLVDVEESPGATVTGDGAIDHALASGSGIYHAVGSCAMGTDVEAVVDPSLRVRGIDGLRVVDASVFPAMPAAGTAAPTMALAWHAADLVLAGR